MFRLAAFGGLVLTDETGSDVATQRRRLALLALLAVAHGRGLSRDRLLAFLWPESDADRARHSLEQLLYTLRRQVNEELFTGSDPIRLNPLTIASDVAAFEQALAAGNDEEAVALYGGPFLDGFHLGEGGDFDDWAEGERARLAAACAAALERLAADASERGDANGAVVLWRRLVALDRLSSRYVLGLLRALADAGDRAEALRLAGSYEALVREELGLPPDAAVRAFVDRLRTSPASASTPAAARVELQSDPVVAPEPPSISVLDAPPSPSPQTVSANATLRRILRTAALVAVTTGGGWAVTRVVGSPSGGSDAEDRVLLGSWRVAGDPSLGYLADTIPALLATWFPVEQGVDRASAQVLVGEASGVGPSRLELSARLVSSAAEGSGGMKVSVTGPIDSLSALVDRLAVRLKARLGGEGMKRVASLNTRSPDALRAFLEGRAHQRSGRHANARISYKEAFEYDSTFALAGLEFALSTARVFRWTILTVDTAYVARGVSLAGDIKALSDHDLWDRAMELAWRGRDDLAPDDRALLDALRVDLPEAPYASDVLTAWEGAVRAAPDRAEAHYWLGYVLLHQGLAMGFEDAPGRAAASFRHVLELDPAHVGALAALIEVAAYDGDFETLRKLKARYLALSSSGAEADYVRWLTAAALQDRRELRSVRARFPSLELGTLTRIQRTSQVTGIGLEDAERADSIILSRANERQEREVALYHAIFLQLNRGRPDAALRLMKLKREVDPGPSLGQTYALRYALMWEGDRAAGESAAIALTGLGGPPATISSTPLWRLWHGDTTGVVAGVARLRETGVSIRAESNALMLEALLADVLHRSDAAALRARLDSFAVRGCCDQPHFINLVSARLHERAGEIPAALAAVRRGRWFFPGEYLSTYLAEEGRLAALAGDTAGAIRAYRRYLNLRSAPEPTARPAADAARAALAALETASHASGPGGR